MRLSRRFALPAAAVTIVGTLTGVGAAGTAAAATPTAAPQASSGEYGGYSTGTGLFVDAAKLANTSLLKAYLAQSAAGTAVGQSLHTQDSLDSPLLTQKSAEGHTAYGHGSALNLGLGVSDNHKTQVAETTAEAVSPPPEGPVKSKGLQIPIKPLLDVDALPSQAQANTTKDAGVCASLSSPISQGEGHIADATVLGGDPLPGDLAVVQVPKPAGGAAVDSYSKTQLAAPAKGSDGNSLESKTVQTIAPIHLLAGTPAQVDIDVLKAVSLTATAGGVPGSASVKYGFVDPDTGAPVSDDTPVLSIKVGSMKPQMLTSQQLLGSDGLQLHLGLADVEIGVPPKPQTAKDGTSASGSVDFVKVKIPGDITDLGASSNGPLKPVLGLVDTLIKGLKPVLSPIQKALNSVIGVADVRVGHMESAVTVPSGGIKCPGRTLPVTKTPNNKQITGSGDITYTITAKNPFKDCTASFDLVDVNKKDSGNVKFGITDVSDDGQISSDKKTVTFTGITLKPGQSVKETVKVHVSSGSGVIEDTSSVQNGTCQGSTGGQTTITGTSGPIKVTVGEPKGPEPSNQPKALAFTGWGGAAPLGALGFVLAGLAAIGLRRRSHRMH
jgi:hypothetical protein